MKAIIQRNLPLDIQYSIINKRYIPIEQSCGAITCANCGQIIANIATVKDAAGKVSDIGFDCLETILINNSLLSTGDIAEYEKTKKMIPKLIRFSKVIKERLEANRNVNITGIRFEQQNYPSDYYPFYWLQNNQEASRDNDFVKLKEVDILFIIENLKNIFTKLTFLYT